MKKTVFIVLIFAATFFLHSACAAQEDFSRSGGEEWTSYGEAAKQGFSLGFIVGVHKAIEELEIFVRSSSYTGGTVQEALPIYNISNSQLKDALDRFYADPANMTVPLKDAALISCGELARSDKERMEKKKRVSRMPPDEQRLVQKADYLKERIKRGEYPEFEVKDEAVVEKDTGAVVPLESEEEIVDFWSGRVFPEEAPIIKEVVRTDYRPAIIISSTAVIFSALFVFWALKRRGRGQ